MVATFGLSVRPPCGGTSALAVGDQRSYVHWSTFMVAEFEGKPVTTVAAKRERNRGLSEVAALS
jgi:hypothetical protein